MQKLADTSPQGGLDRRFYVRSKAFGRFGMRIFKPSLMTQPHWHGHIEINYIRNARLVYIFDGQEVPVEAGQLVMFWAGVPHQLIAVESINGAEPELANIYLSLDTFLFMPHIPDLQVALLSGGMVLIPDQVDAGARIHAWYQDYRANSPGRLDILKMELNAMFRRICLQKLEFVKPPWSAGKQEQALASPHVRHVVTMIREVLDHLDSPLRNSDVTAKTGLHMNYALTLFSRVMNIPLKQFTIRMRLLRARGMLLESDRAISTIANESGFSSISQFYAHFTNAYGTSPQQLRQNLLRPRA